MTTIPYSQSDDNFSVGDTVLYIRHRGGDWGTAIHRCRVVSTSFGISIKETEALGYGKLRFFSCVSPIDLVLEKRFEAACQ